MSQWLKIHLPMQGTQVQPLFGEIRSSVLRSIITGEKPASCNERSSGHNGDPECSNQDLIQPNKSQFKNDMAEESVH